MLNNDAGLLRNGEEGAVIKTSPTPPEFPVSRSIGIGAGNGGGGGTSWELKTLLTAACNATFKFHKKTLTKLIFLRQNDSPINPNHFLPSDKLRARHHQSQ